MIDVKAAVRLATEYLRQLYPGPIEGVRLEEVELSNDEAFWYVTLSFLGDPPMPDREYKQFKMAAADGAIRYMKIRPLQ